MREIDDEKYYEYRDDEREPKREKGEHEEYQEVDDLRRSREWRS